MKFAIRLIEYLGDSRRLVRLAVAAERAGFDAVWFPHDPFMRHTWVLTTAAATATRRIGIGSVATNPYTTDPSEIATWLATLDELSGGRALLGLGLHTTEMVGWTGFEARDCLARTCDAVDIVRRLLRGEVVEHGGGSFDWSDQCYLRFSPLRAEVPIYVAAFGEDYQALSGRIGDGSLPMITPPASAAQVVPPILRGLAESGRARERFTVSGCAWLSLSETRQAAAAIMRDMIAYFGPYLEDEALATVGLSPEDMLPLKALVAERNYQAAADAVSDDMLALGIVGTPAEVIEQIEAVGAMGVDEINLGGPLGPDPEAAIELLGRRVIPHFRA